MWGLNEPRHGEDLGVLVWNMQYPTTCSEQNCQPEVTAPHSLLSRTAPHGWGSPSPRSLLCNASKGSHQADGMGKHFALKGKISCLVPMIPSLEKEESKPGWSLKEQAGWEATGMQERKKFKQNSTLSGPCLPCTGLCPPSGPWFHIESVHHFSFLPLKSQNLGGNW